VAVVGDRARARVAGTRFADLRWTAETGSTNQDLLALAAQGAPEGVVLVTDHQTAGRGRLGRQWQAPPGASLLVSVLLRPALAIADGHLLTAAVGVAAAEACEQVAGVTPALKWPNDLVLDDRKLGGILAESTVGGDRFDAVVVGLGLNVSWPAELPPDLASSAVSLGHAVGHDVDREELLGAFLTRLDRWYPPGTDLAARYRELLGTIGREVRVTLPDGDLEGRAVDVTPHGHLVVESDGTRRTVTAGDVVHLRVS
jgi:BirA family biotin operon repressor/biotin-[acetyl-CoA-carboxylase] ligase